jgi:hypothetical protein
MKMERREQINDQKILLIGAFHNWQIGEITSEEYNQYSEKFTDEVIRKDNDWIKVHPTMLNNLTRCYLIPESEVK